MRAPAASLRPPDVAALTRLRLHLESIVTAALAACEAGRLLDRSLASHPPPTAVQFNVIAAGKAAHPMAAAFSETYGGRVRETVIADGAHPLPDASSVDSGARALRLAEASCVRGECVVVLLSGGASAMLAALPAGISLADKVTTTKALLRSGLPIAEMNAVRKHISAIKGGRLGAAARHSVTYAISDVHAPVEDDAAVIGSGPTVGDSSTFADAIRALMQGRIWNAVPAGVTSRLMAGARGELSETIKPSDPALASSRFVLAGSRRDAMAGAVEAARSLGYHILTLDRPTLGEAREAALAFVSEAETLSASVPRPTCVLGWGETTVTVPGGGRGGRNQEFALAAAAEINRFGRCALASVGTDGIDGPTDAAGAAIDTTTLARARDRGLDPAIALRDHDTYPFFRSLGDLILTGPTGTNVGDLQILLVE